MDRPDPFPLTNQYLAKLSGNALYGAGGWISGSQASGSSAQGKSALARVQSVGLTFTRIQAIDPQRHAPSRLSRAADSFCAKQTISSAACAPRRYHGRQHDRRQFGTLVARQSRCQSQSKGEISIGDKTFLRHRRVQEDLHAIVRPQASRGVHPRETF